MQHAVAEAPRRTRRQREGLAGRKQLSVDLAQLAVVASGRALELAPAIGASARARGFAFGAKAREGAAIRPASAGRVPSERQQFARAGQRQPRLTLVERQTVEALLRKPRKPSNRSRPQSAHAASRPAKSRAGRFASPPSRVAHDRRRVGPATRRAAVRLKDVKAAVVLQRWVRTVGILGDAPLAPACDGDGPESGDTPRSFDRHNRSGSNQLGERSRTSSVKTPPRAVSRRRRRVACSAKSTAKNIVEAKPPAPRGVRWRDTAGDGRLSQVTEFDKHERPRELEPGGPSQRRASAGAVRGVLAVHKSVPQSRAHNPHAPMGEPDQDGEYSPSSLVGQHTFLNSMPWRSLSEVSREWMRRYK